MTTQCHQITCDFPPLGRRQVRARFDGGDISSDGGVLLLRKVEELTGTLS